MTKLPAEILDKIFSYTHDREIIINFSQFMSAKTLRKVLHNYSIEHEVICCNIDMMRIFHRAGFTFTRDHLNAACLFGHLNVVKFLIPITDFCKTTAMEWSCCGNNPKIVKLLRKLGAKISENNLKTAASHGNYKVVRYIVTTTNFPVRSSIELANNYHHSSIVNFLEIYKKF